MRYDLLAAMLTLTGVVPVEKFIEEKGKEVRKCLLPSCEILTSHNGGYCCANHCNRHRESIRRNK